MGTGLVYMTLSALYRMTRPPLFIGGLAILWGYVWSLIAKKERLVDPAFRRFLREYQWACLLQGKSKATAQYDQQGAHRWNPTQAGFPFS